MPGFVLGPDGRAAYGIHVHDGEDEMLYVIAGELTGTCGDDTWSARAVTGPPQLDRQIAARSEPPPAVA